MRHCFGECVFDTEARELRRSGGVIALSPKAFQLLTLLLEARPRPLRQEDLRDALWPSTHVGYTSLARVINEVRKAIGDSAAAPRLVRTLPRFGYAFAGEAVIDTTGDRRLSPCAFVGRDREYPLLEGETLVGRGTECGVRLPSSAVSRAHARVRVEARTATVEDQGSRNGTWVNGRRLESPTLLADGDEVTFGTIRMVFRCAVAEDTTRTGLPDRSPHGS